MTRRPRRDGDRATLFAWLGIGVLAAVAVVGYVSYTALSGLPFQDRRTLIVEVPNANRLIEGSDVRIGGVRVGRVAGVAARPAHAGRAPHARVELALDGSVAPLAADTTVRVRPASVLGASYLELSPGAGLRKLADGATLPLSRATTSLELTDLFDVFERRAAEGFRGTVRGFSGGLAGRGAAINSTIGSLSRGLGPLTEVAGAIGSPDARLGRFLRAWASTAGALAPVSTELSRLFGGAAVTFGALERERRAVGAGIAAAAPAEIAATAALRDVRPGLERLARLATQLRPAAGMLPRALDHGNRALAAGVAPLRATPPLARDVRRALDTLGTVSRRPGTTGALRKLGELMRAGDRSLAVLAPAQMHCNIVALLGQNYSAFTGTLGFGHGPAFWNLPLSTPGAETDGLQANAPAADLNVNYTPNENAQECESGNEPDAPGQGLIGNPPGLQRSSTRDTDPPPGARERAMAAGLIDGGGGRR